MSSRRALTLGVSVAAGVGIAAVLWHFRSRRPEKGAAPLGADSPPRRKSFAAFLSHFKLECGGDARLVQKCLKEELPRGSDLFLDSDNLNDLRLLVSDTPPRSPPPPPPRSPPPPPPPPPPPQLQHVRDTDVLILLQSKGVLTRPWVLLELYTAIANDVPIVALNIAGRGYDYAAESHFMMHLDTMLEERNPGTTAMLAEHGVDPTDMAYRLSDTLPFIISTVFDPNASHHAIRASMLELKEAMACAKPQPQTITKEEWLARREAAGAPPQARQEHGKSHSAQEPPSLSRVGGGLADIPETVPELPAAFLGRPGLLDQLKAVALGDGAHVVNMALTSRKAKSKSTVHGMGGVGKTTVSERVSE